MKDEGCQGCAHDRPNQKGCKILTERTKRGKLCWARMTKEELQKAEKAIERYKYRLLP